MRGATPRPQDVGSNGGKHRREALAGSPAGPAAETAVADLRQSLAAVGIATREQVAELEQNSSGLHLGPDSMSNHQRAAAVRDAAAAALRAEQEPERVGAARTVARVKPSAIETDGETPTTTTVHLAPLGGPPSNFEAASSGQGPTQYGSGTNSAAPGPTAPTAGSLAGGKSGTGTSTPPSAGAKAMTAVASTAAGTGKAAAKAAQGASTAAVSAANTAAHAGQEATSTVAKVGKGAADLSQSAASTAVDASKTAASTTIDVGRSAACNTVAAGQGAASVGLSAASTAADAGEGVVKAGLGVMGQAADAGMSAASTAADAGKGVVKAGLGVTRQAADAGISAASTAADVGKGAVKAGLGVTRQAADAGISAASTAADVGKGAVKAGLGVMGQAADAGISAASTAADVGKGAVKAGLGVMGQAANAGVSGASTAARLGKGAVDLGMGTTGKALELGKSTAATAVGVGKGAATTAIDIGKSAATTTIGIGKSAATTTVDIGQGAASGAVKLGKGAVGAATAAASAAGSTARGAVHVAGEALQRTGSLVEWSQQQASQVSTTIYSSTIHPVLSFLWWLYLTLPYQTVAWLVNSSWALVQRVAGAWLSAGYTVTSTTTGLINRVADVAFRVILGGLRNVNSSMDGLVNHTPRLIRDTLAEVAGGRRARRRAAGVGRTRHAAPTTSTTSSSSGSGLEEEEEAAIEPDRLAMLEETDVARAANEALHNVFAHEEEESGKGGEASQKRGTLLAEARLMVWHAWMLVALQVTAVRVVLRMTEGMFTWAASAWLQLAKASAILAVIAVAAPAAASAAAVAWLCRFVLNQVLSLRVYGQRLRGLWATPLHSVAVRANALLQPYLLPEPAEGSQLEEGSKRQPGFAIEVEGEASADESEGEEVDEQDSGLLFGLLPSLTRMRLGAAQALRQAEDTTGQWLPHLEGQQHEGEEGAAEATPPDHDSVSGVGVSRAQLRRAAGTADEAWSKSSTLAAATAFTLADAGRVLLQALAQRLNIPLPSWLPGLHSASVTHAGEEAAVVDFNAAAGKGPATQ